MLLVGKLGNVATNTQVIDSVGMTGRVVHYYVKSIR